MSARWDRVVANVVHMRLAGRWIGIFRREFDPARQVYDRCAIGARLMGDDDDDDDDGVHMVRTHGKDGILATEMTR
jgi:hypothetical protein